MRSYKFTDPDNEDYEITVPNYVVKEVIFNYLQKTYYWSLALGCLIIGFLIGVSV